MQSNRALFSLILCFGLMAPGLPATPKTVSIPPPRSARPFLFVTQVPMAADVMTTVTVFNNHRGETRSAGRGGDLWIRYGDDSLRNLTAAAGYGVTTTNQFTGAIAVRDPAMYWDGTKAVFSMVVGAPAASAITSPVYLWQLYEVTGFLNPTGTITITKVPNQPAYNNINPAYGTDDRIIFASDMPRGGQTQLYPTLDEYNMRETVTGLWSLDPATGNVFQVDVSPSGDFSPIVDSFGRVVFTRWDHLERDQQADVDALFFPTACRFCTFNYSDESITATKLMTNAEIFPEPRPQRTDILTGTNLNGHHMNEFLPWAFNEDGTSGETLNHVGRHELLDHIPAAINNDPNIKPLKGSQGFNQNRIQTFLQIREDAAHPGTYFGTNALELTHASGQIISMTAPPGLSADQMSVTYLTPRETLSTSGAITNSTGHYRDPLPMSDGALIAAHTWITGFDVPSASKSAFSFRLTQLAPVSGGVWSPIFTFTNGISRTVSYWVTNTLVTYSGYFWELSPVEVVSRTRPARITATIPSIEQNIFASAGVNLGAFQNYLQQNDLALVVVRNVTTRDHADVQQPFRLQVGLTGTATLTGTGLIYREDYMQFLQADQIRGMGGITNPVPGRRVLPQLLHDPAALAANPPAPGAPPGSAAIWADGSVAAFVPARRAMSWQMLDNTSASVVRERFWVTFQPGEVRVCTSCHGLSSTDQAGNTAPTNPPAALYALLDYWKIQNHIPTHFVFVPNTMRGFDAGW